jgi:DNA polymerase-3 subunit gamma/tau
MAKVGDPMEYTALYREWRPGTFDEVVGQDHVVRILKNQIKTERISHAYLFCGPRGTGKTSTAKIFAKAINCTDPREGNPCGHCQVCNVIDSENNMDVIEIDAASHTGVENIREIRDKVKYPPSAGRYRVYIIDEVHMLSTSAFNAFLKTLEEPPEHIVFILATTEPHRLPSTILSRCQRHDFRRISLGVIMDRLRTIANSVGVEVDDQALETISRWSEGGMRDSISLLDQCMSFSGSSVTESDVLAILGTAGREFLFDVVDNIMMGNISALLIQVDNLMEEGRDIAAFLKDLIYHLRNLLITKICDDPTGLLDVSQSTLEQYRQQSSRMDQSRLIRSIEILSELDADIRWSTKPRIMLEMAMVKICRPQDGDSLEDLRDRVAVLERQIAQGIPAVSASDTDEPSYPQPSDTQFPESYDVGVDNEDNDGVHIDKAHKMEDETVPQVMDIEKEDKDTIDIKPGTPAAEKVDYDSVWSEVLKRVRKDRIAIFPLLRDTRLQPNDRNNNIVNLIFPEDQGFFVAAIEKEENSKYIEELIAQVAGQHFKLKCYTRDNAPGSGEMDVPEPAVVQEDGDEESEYDIVQKAIEIFGDEYVEVIDD